MKQKQFRSERRYRFKRFARKTWSVFNSMHKAVSIGVVAGWVLTFAHTTQAAAQSRTAPDSITGWERELDELVVTSSKAELTLQQTARLVTLITRVEIERQPAQSVQDLLKNVVGLDVRQRGSNGVLAGVSVRGGTFEQTAILLNGVNLTNPQTGHYNLDLPVNLSDIERIEIIQGPSSLLYGAGAFSGGIHIVTKKNSDTGVYLNLEGGMYSHAAAHLRGSLKSSASAHSLSAGYASSNGYMANSDYQLFSALWQSHWNTEVATLDFQFGINDKAYGANTFYSAKYPNQFDDTRSVFGAIKGEAGTKLKLTPQLYWNRHYDHYQLIRNTSTGENFHQTDVFGFNLNAQYRWAAGMTNFGGEIRNEGILSSNLGKDSVFHQPNYRKTDNRSNIHYFLEHTYLHRGLTVSAGLLFNYNTAFRNESGLFPHIHAAYWLTGNVKLFASWNKAIRMPTFTDLSYRGLTHSGNSNVQPEKSEAFDAGIQYNRPVVTASVSGFYMKAIDPIDWVKALPGDPWESRNLDNFAKTGFEVHAALRFCSSVLNVGYRLMNQSQKDAGWITYYLDDYIKHKFTVGLSHPVYKGISADWQFRWQERQGTYTQYENNTSTGKEVAYPAFSLFDLRLNWQLQDFKIHLTANNLFNVAYYDLGNIPQPGFWLMGGVSWTVR
ncbi:MAG: TonB-dependent receptor [Dysgonamonadaceae bacterium]|jgi:iron complex outermembrane receptor protein|nr:TonB-dependent receptor [Dysgonamonadaceae bacterium]